MIYEAVNRALLLQIPDPIERVLDIGCGTGTLGKSLKQGTKCEVIGVTYSHSEAAFARQWLDLVLVRDLNNFGTSELGAFDCIVCSHILEHLYYPENLLIKLKHNLTPSGILIVALPNVVHWKQRLQFLRGRFRYTDGGLMDRTHFRFFDWQTALELLEKHGFTVTLRTAEGNFPLPIVRKLVPSVASYVDKVATKAFPNLLSVKFILVAHKT